MKAELEILLKQRLNPDVYLILQIDSGTASKRKLSFEKKENIRAERERLEKNAMLKPSDLTNEMLQSVLKSDETLLEDLKAR